VYTSDEKGAGTDAHISIALMGTKDKSEIISLSHSDKKNKFEQGKIDTFVLDCADLGDITSITLITDGKGAGAKWKVNKVEIIDQATTSLYRFAADSWLNKGQLALKLTDKGESKKLVEKDDE